MNHFEFNRHICLDWIDSQNCWPKNKRTYQHQARSGDITSSTTRSTNNLLAYFMNISPGFTDKYLCPLSGNICVPLQESETYWPVPNLEKNQVVNCIVGQWAQTRRCEVFWTFFLHSKVTLFVAYVVPFHNIPHLSNIKISPVISSSVQEDSEE